MQRGDVCDTDEGGLLPTKSGGYILKMKPLSQLRSHLQHHNQALGELRVTM